MASILSTSSVNALKHHSTIPFRQVQDTQLKQSGLLWRQPIAKRKVIVNSQNPAVSLPKLDVAKYQSMRAKQLTKALDEWVPLKHPHVLREAMRYTMLPGGKHFFSSLCIASCEAVGGSESAVMPLACAIEMLHNMAIMQDDLPALDNEELRRGKPTNHKVFGEAATILACQSLLFLAVENLAVNTKNVSSERLLRTIVEICKGYGSEGFSAGEFMDVLCEGKEANLSDLEYIHDHKCGKIMEALMVGGAIVGGGSEEEIEVMRKCSKCVGMAFQVWDDVVDVIGSPTITEQTGRDALRGKSTYPDLVGIDKAKKYAVEQKEEAKRELLKHFDPVWVAPLYHLVDSITPN